MHLEGRRPYLKLLVFEELKAALSNAYNGDPTWNEICEEKGKLNWEKLIRFIRGKDLFRFGIHFRLVWVYLYFNDIGAILRFYWFLFMFDGALLVVI